MLVSNFTGPQGLNEVLVDKASQTEIVQLSVVWQIKVVLYTVYLFSVVDELLWLLLSLRDSEFYWERDVLEMAMQLIRPYS